MRLSQILLYLPCVLLLHSGCGGGDSKGQNKDIVTTIKVDRILVSGSASEGVVTSISGVDDEDPSAENFSFTFSADGDDTILDLAIDLTDDAGNETSESVMISIE